MMLWARSPSSPRRQMPEMTLESASETLIEAYRNRQAEKAKFAVGSQEVLTDQPLPPTTLATYSEAVNEFTKNANAFIEQLRFLARLGMRMSRL